MDCKDKHFPALFFWRALGFAVLFSAFSAPWSSPASTESGCFWPIKNLPELLKALPQKNSQGVLLDTELVFYLDAELPRFNTLGQVEVYIRDIFVRPLIQPLLQALEQKGLLKDGIDNPSLKKFFREQRGIYYLHTISPNFYSNRHAVKVFCKVSAQTIAFLETHFPKDVFTAYVAFK